VQRIRGVHGAEIGVIFAIMLSGALLGLVVSLQAESFPCFVPFAVVGVIFGVVYYALREGRLYCVACRRRV
jgi:hypothetical protein